MRRESNEDFLFASDKSTGNLDNLFIVADGMGGHNAGEVASELAVETVIDCVRTTDSSDISSIFSDAITKANQKIYLCSKESPSTAGMGTTIVVASVLKDKLFVSSVGDSRLYLFKDDRLLQITEDHTVVAELLKVGEISKPAAKRHPKRHMLTRAVGVSSEIKVDFFTVSLSGDEQMLLATDGLMNMLEDVDIEEILRSDASVETKVKLLVDAANNNGGDDNITLILVDIKE